MIKYVYIASPYTIGNVEENVKRSIRAADGLLEVGLVPFAPLLCHYWHQLYPRRYEAWIEYSMEWLTKCDAVLRLEGESRGADEEVKRATELGLPVYNSIYRIIQIVRLQ